MKPRLSIILPVLNEAAQLSNSLQSLQCLRADCELLLVDGGSDDDSATIATALVDQVLHSLPGRAIQMNAGAAQAQAETLLFLHADTQLPVNAVACIVQAMADGYLWGRFDVQFDNAKPVFKLIGLMMNARSRLTGIATGDQALFVSRQAFDKVAGFPSIPLMEDIAISARLKKLGQPCCLKDKVLTSARRWQRDGVLKTMLCMWSLRLRFFLGADPADLVAIYYRRH